MALSPNPGFHDERELFDALLTASGLKREDLPLASGHAPQASFTDPAGDATMVPVLEAVASSAGAVSMEPAPIRMAPTIRTKLLRPRDGLFPLAVGQSDSTQRASPALVAAGLVGLVVVVAVSSFVLWPRHSPLAPPADVGAGSPTPIQEETTSPAVSPSPSAPGDESPTP